MIGLNKIGLNQVQLNRLRLNAPFPAYGKMAGGGGSGDGFPQLPGDVTRWHFGGLTNEMMAAMDDPRIEDADGKGRFLSFKNFAWKEGSGISDVYPGFILGDGVDDFAVTEQQLNFEDTYTVYTAFIPFQDDPVRGMEMCGKDFKKDLYIYYSGTHLVYYTSGLNGFIPVHINQLHIIVCKRDKTNAVIKNLITGESKTFSVSELIDNPGVYYLWRYRIIGASTSRAAIAGQTICNGHYSTDEEDAKVLAWYKKEYPWLFPDQAWTVTGKTNEDEDRATIANITGNGNDLILSNLAFSGNSGYGSYVYNFNSFTFGEWEIIASDIKSNSFKVTGTGIGTNRRICAQTGGSSVANWHIKVSGMKSGDIMYIGNANKGGDYLTIEKDGQYHFEKTFNEVSPNGIWYQTSNETDILIEQIPEYEGYLVTDGVDDSGRAVGLTISKDFTLVGEWILFSKTSVNAGLSIHPQIHIFNRPEAIQITFRTAGKTLPVKSLKAICSDGRCYDENWSELKINVGEFTDNKGTLFVASNGTNYAQIAFKNLGIYDNHILSKDDCIKAYNYLQTLKAK